MRDPTTPLPPVTSGARSDAELVPERSRLTERGNASRGAAFDTKALVKRALAGAAVVGLTELALGRRLYYAWEVLRHGVTWLGKPAAGARPAEEPQPRARSSPEFPTPQQAMEDVIQDALDVGKRAFDRHRPMIDRARLRAVERLKEPRIGAAVIAGATLGAIASFGVMPTVLGAGAAYMAHRKQASKEGSERDATVTGGPERG